MSTSDKAKNVARDAGDHPAVEYGARLGYAVSGLLHLLMGWIAVRIATGTGGGTADQSGALSTLAKAPGGRLILWVAVVGFALLALWQLTEAITGGLGGEVSDRIKAAAKTVMYAALAFTSSTFARGGKSSSRKQSTDFTASLMENGAGRLLIGLIGVGVLAVGGYHVYKGWAKKFLEDLQEHPGTWAVHAGRIGYIAKGIALAVLGFLFILAALHKKASEAAGLDAALRKLREAPFGTVLLIVVGVGIAIYGVYSFARARYARV